MPIVRVWLPIAASTALFCQGAAQAGQDEDQPRTTVRAISETVILDLVVRDRDGRPVEDLRQSEIEVYENGGRQEILSFRFVGGDRFGGGELSTRGLEGADPEERSTRVGFDPFRHVSLVTLVFERLPDTARHMARQAALHFIDTGMQENTLVAVFAIDNRLYLLEHYTNDRDALREAVLKATSGAYGQFDSQSTDAIQGQMQEISRRLKRDELTDSILGGSSVTPDLQDMEEVQLEEVTLNVLRQAERMMLYQRGHQTVTALLALVEEAGRLSGRKTLILLSAGIQVPHAVVGRYRTLISQANRANVSIYTVDARGLTTEEIMSDSKYMLSQAVQASRDQRMTGLGRMVTRDEALIDEYAETSIRLNKYGTLDNLARSTGGFFVSGTNDPSHLVDRISEDIRSYYEVAYAPSIMEYDGRFREITVRVTRPGIRVQSRSGYFALPPGTQTPFQPYEIPMLVALNSDPRPRDFDFRSRILRFDPEGDEVRHVIVIEVPFQAFHFVEDRREGLYNTRFSILVLVKDESDRIVGRYTQDYPLRGPLDRVDRVKSGSVVFMRETLFPPGHYTVESAVVDQVTRRSSARRSRLVVRPTSPELSMSSISIVRRVDPVADDDDVEGPFRYQDGRIVPTLAGSILPDSDSGVGVYCVVYPSRKTREAPRLVLDVLQNGRVLASGTQPLPPPDSDGAIRFAGTVSVAGLAPGSYEVRVYAVQGSSVVKEHAFFSLGSPALQ
jgi:VWFA-related protein